MEHAPRIFSLREAEILHHLSRGASNADIAHKLKIADTTVKVHLRALFNKLKVNNRTQAAVWYHAMRPVEQILVKNNPT
jgi:two-component system nitrate/nitrite response regulator NarL